MDAVAIPPLGRMNMVAIWIETLFYGANTILFITCLWVLLSHVQRINVPLLASTILLFSMSTAHVILSLVQVLQAFFDPKVLAVPHGSDLYWAVEAVPIYSAKNFLYNFTVFAQDILLIWRLYMVWGRSWKICIVPIIMECVHVAAILVAAILLTKPSTNVFSKSVQGWGLSGWAMDVAVNTLVTFGIAYRLWLADRSAANANSHQASYKRAMFTVLESGAIFCSATIILFALDASGSLAGNIGISPVSQLACTTPMLIIARVGLMTTRNKVSESNSGTTSAGMRTANRSGARRIEVSVQRTEDVEGVYPLSDFKSERASATSVEEGRVVGPTYPAVGYRNGTSAVAPFNHQ